MGHYDADYEHDEREARKLKLKQAKKLLSKLDEVEKLMHGLNIPQRFGDDFEDFENWMLAHYGSDE